MTSPMLFQFIGESFEIALNTYVNVTASNVITTFTTTAVLSTTLYYVMTGFLMITGRVEAPFSTFMLSAGKFLLISAFALNADMYMQWVVESIRGMETGLTSAFAGSGGLTPTSVYGVVDDALGKGWGLSANLWEKAGNRGFAEIGMALGEYLNAIIIAIATIIIAIPAGAMIVAAKAILSLMLGIGPFFVMCLMWPITKQFFDKWFAQVMTCLMQIALLAAVLSFAIKIFLAFVVPVDIDSNQNPLFTSLQLLGLTLTMLWLLYRAYDIGAGLGGGMSSSAITFGQIASQAMGASRNLSNAINPTSSRLDPRTGHQTTGSRLEHLAMGRSFVARNPAYRQATLERLHTAWQKPTGGNAKRGE